VWWIDKLTPEAFSEGFGLTTPMLSGELKVHRYYSYFDKAVSTMKRLMIKQCNVVDEGALKVLNGVLSLGEIYRMAGGDFWVVVPCVGDKTKEIMEGTRLTLQKHAGEQGGEGSYDFSIRTPGTPERWEQFSKEFDKLWEEDVKEAIEGCSGRVDLVQVSLKVFYYWVHFAPLTRGSAAVGHGMMLSLLRAGGKEMRLGGGQLEGVQLDWEAILRSDADEFVSAWSGWLRGTLVDIASADVHACASVASSLPDLKSRVCALTGFD